MNPNQPTKNATWFDVMPEHRELFDRLLGGFIPPDSFDVHAHLYRKDQQGTDGSPAASASAAGPSVVDLDCFRTSQAHWMGNAAPKDGLFFALPKVTMDMPASNTFIANQIEKNPDSRWLVCIKPDDDPNAVERIATTSSCCGFKVYHIFSPGHNDTFHADCEEFIPEWAWQIADQHGLCIMLHLVKSRALSDPSNTNYIRERCVRYPNAKLILAHAARGFCGRHTVEGIADIAGLENVYFDTSAVCESAPIEAILRTFGPTRLMYGSDFPVSEGIGRCVSLGDGFFWLNRHNVDFSSQPTFSQPTLVGIESLIAVKLACGSCKLTDDDIEHIFAINARNLLGIPIGSS